LTDFKLAGGFAGEHAHRIFEQLHELLLVDGGARVGLQVAELKRHPVLELFVVLVLAQFLLDEAAQADHFFGDGDVLDGAFAEVPADGNQDARGVLLPGQTRMVTADLTFDAIGEIQYFGFFCFHGEFGPRVAGPLVAYRSVFKIVCFDFGFLDFGNACDVH